MTLRSHYDPFVGTDVPPETLDNACLAACLPGFIDVWPALRPAEPGYTFDSAANEMLPRYEQMRYDRLMARLPGAARGWRPAAVELVGAAPCPAGPAPAGDRRVLLRLRGLPLDVGYEDVLRWVRAAAAGGGAAAQAGLLVVVDGRTHSLGDIHGLTPPQIQNRICEAAAAVGGPRSWRRPFVLRHLCLRAALLEKNY